MRNLAMALALMMSALVACSDQSPSTGTATERDGSSDIRLTGTDADTTGWVFLKRGPARQSEARANALVRAAGGRLVSTSPRLASFVATLPPNSSEQLRANENVVLVSRLPKLSFADHTTQSGAPFGLDRIDQRALSLDGAYRYMHTGAGVNIYIVDTGVNEDANGDLGDRIESSVSFYSSDSSSLDCMTALTNGHGTSVASAAGGTIYGVAKSATLHNLKVGCDGPDGLSVPLAMEWLAAQAQLPAVVNLSFGTCQFAGDTIHPNGGTPIGGVCPSPAPGLDSAVSRLADLGFVVVMSAGNVDVSACWSSPGRVRMNRSDVLVVAASTAADQRAGFSNHGACVDVFAPGDSVTLTRKNGSAGPRAGTSFSAPYVAGVAALVLEEHPTWTPQQVADAVRLRATIGVLGDVSGAPNRLLYAPERLTLLLSGAPPPSAVEPNTPLTWTAASTGGLGHATYAWASRFHWYDGYIEPWQSEGSGSQKTLTIPGYTGFFEMRVTATAEDDTVSAHRAITVDCSASICAYAIPRTPPPDR